MIWPCHDYFLKDKFYANNMVEKTENLLHCDFECNHFPKH